MKKIPEKGGQKPFGDLGTWGLGDLGTWGLGDLGTSEGDFTTQFEPISQEFGEYGFYAIASIGSAGSVALVLIGVDQRRQYIEPISFGRARAGTPQPLDL
jgi:hypothetical protein